MRIFESCFKTLQPLNVVYFFFCFYLFETLDLLKVIFNLFLIDFNLVDIISNKLDLFPSLPLGEFDKKESLFLRLLVDITQSVYFVNERHLSVSHEFLNGQNYLLLISLELFTGLLIPCTSVVVEALVVDSRNCFFVLFSRDAIDFALIFDI